jgi:hypothetical protein
MRSVGPASARVRDIRLKMFIQPITNHQSPTKPNQRLPQGGPSFEPLVVGETAAYRYRSRDVVRPSFRENPKSDSSNVVRPSFPRSVRTNKIFGSRRGSALLKPSLAKTDILTKSVSFSRNGTAVQFFPSLTLLFKSRCTVFLIFKTWHAHGIMRADGIQPAFFCQRTRLGG